MQLPRILPTATLALVFALGAGAGARVARAESAPAATLAKADGPVHKARPFRLAASTRWLVLPGVMVTARVAPNIDVEAAVNSAWILTAGDIGVRLRTGEGSRVAFLYARAGAFVGSCLFDDCDWGNGGAIGSAGLGMEGVSRAGWSVAAQGGAWTMLSERRPLFDLQLSVGRRF